jgi:hypothetical protein
MARNVKVGLYSVEECISPLVILQIRRTEEVGIGEVLFYFRAEITGEPKAFALIDSQTHAAVSRTLSSLKVHRVGKSTGSPVSQSAYNALEAVVLKKLKRS